MKRFKGLSLALILVSVVFLSLYSGCAGSIKYMHLTKSSHKYVEVVVSPTCTKEGYTIHACECGASYKTDYTPIVEHELIDTDRVEPTCFFDGHTAGKKCKKCSYVQVEEQVIPALNIRHNFISGACAVCGKEDDKSFYQIFVQKVKMLNNTEEYMYETELVCRILAVKKDNANHPTANEIIIPNTIRNDDLGVDFKVISLADDLFRSYRRTKDFTIQENVIDIGERVFRGCVSLERIAVSVNNEKYCDVDFVLYTKDKTTLLACPAKKQQIVLEGEVNNILEGAFGDCAILEKIFYKGSLQDKSNIQISADNKVLNSATWYYFSQERPQEEGNFWRYVNGEITVWE